MTKATREQYSSVEASWTNRDTGEEDKAVAGDGSPIHKIRHNYATETSAQRAAQGKLDELRRETDSFNVTLVGDPFISAEGRINAVGFRSGIEGVWSIKSVQHSIDGGGFTTSISAEKPNA